ncbi:MULTISPECIES: MurR/RpiR family transcriptional regulator [unclassified Stappia]|uniref:MurR/RpiR family transcriptional regulator n=1 Tax=unclassified Stappia TaxID=2629676 RepID=UPI001646C94D|nr:MULTISPECIES: MurR/RpiR family transcriptional regulator [unclassified Stappia]
MTSLAEEIRERLGECTATERRAALALLANYPVLGLGTVAQFASAAGVSSPTILRFAARMGCGTYAALQTRLRTELEDQLKSPLAKAKDGAQAGGTGTGIGAVAEAARANIGETFRHLPAAELEAVVSLLSDERRTLYLLGGRFTDALARYMAAHLRILRSGVMHMAGQEGNWRDALLDVGRRDVLVVFDIRRYQADLGRMATAAAKRGATVVLITDSWLSPIASVATHVLPARISVPSPWDSSAALMVIAETLVAGVTARDPERSERRMSALEAYRDEEDPKRPSPRPGEAPPTG